MKEGERKDGNKEKRKKKKKASKELTFHHVLKMTTACGK